MKERLHKIIAQSGLASRRGAEELIRSGMVRVNGILVKEMGLQIEPDTDTVSVSGKPLPTPQRLTYLFYKPVGVVCSRRRQGEERIVNDFLPAFPPVYPVGRLDKNSEGLLLVSNDGALTQRLTHPSFHERKEYQVIAHWKERVKDRGWLEHRLLQGVKLGDGLAKADALTCKENGPNLQLDITVHEGRTHLIRRMLATCGLTVIRLKRIRIGWLSLENLRPGQYRVLTSTELTRLG